MSDRNLVTATQEEIRQRTYKTFETRGREKAKEADHWFTVKGS
jgi:hypothetical protein